MKKRIASVLVALVMVLSLVPKTSWAWTSTVTTLEQLKSAMSELSYNNTIEIVVSGTIEISETLNIRPTRTTNGSMAWYEYTTSVWSSAAPMPIASWCVPRASRAACST